MMLLTEVLAVAGPATQSAKLAWDPGSGSGVAGYNIYYGPAPGSYTNEISVPNVTSAQVQGLQQGAVYYFTVTAYDASGIESIPSNEVSYRVPPVVLAVRAAVNNGLLNALQITASGGILNAWTLESSADLLHWSPVATGTNAAVNISVNVQGAPGMCFRLKQ